MDTVYTRVLPMTSRSRAGAGQALAELAAQLLGVSASQLVVSRGESGQPVVQAATGQVWVSLSYGPGVLAVAASLAGPVGVDIEGPTRPEVLRLAERWFDAQEAQWLGAQSPAEQPQAFLQLWTAKEALGKALGTGLRGDGLRRRVPLPPIADGSFQAASGQMWLAHPALATGLVLAVAVGPILPGAGPLTTVAVEQDLGHPELARNTARSRTSLPVVVRGN